MTVWIDLANAPHVPFFAPIVAELERRRHTCVITARDFNHTVELARLTGLSVVRVGAHGGRKDVAKLANLPVRVRQLLNAVGGDKPSVAVSHNSYTQTLAARISRIPVVTIMDYEGQPANHIAFRAANRVVVPESFPRTDLRRFGARENKTVRYPGFKEQVYLDSFEPSDDGLLRILEEIDPPHGWDLNAGLLVTVRTPATIAAYHHFHNPLFDSLLERLSTMPGVLNVLLCRTEEQERAYRGRFSSIRIPANQLDGKDLVYHSDYVFSAGGTMNREAAIVGTPAYTLFAGKLPAIDAELIRLGRLRQLRTVADVKQLELSKTPKLPTLRNPGLIAFFADQIELLAKRGHRSITT